MLKDVYLRSLFIPLLGMTLPFLSGLVDRSSLRSFEFLGAAVFFTIVSFLIWQGCHVIHQKLRAAFSSEINPFVMLLAASGASAMYALSITFASSFIWQSITGKAVPWKNILLFSAYSIMAVILFTLVYEILHLVKEKERNARLVDKLDREKMQAELEALKNELDPHFMFNSLNTLNHLINSNPAQAHAFNNKLASVYKYFLLNKSKELVTLEREMEFIYNYFFLLKIRHEEKLELSHEIGEENEKILIPPCALQILVENAIKHNEFSENNPLKIKIRMNGEYLKVSNNTKPKPYAVSSTGIGLNNLKTRYRLLMKKDIVIESDRESYTVKLPLIR